MNAVDQLGAVQAQIAELRKLEAALKGELLESVNAAGGVAETPHSTVIEGDLFRAVVTETERATTDWKKIALKFEPSHQLVRANTKRTEVITIKVNARSTAARRAA